MISQLSYSLLFKVEREGEESPLRRSLFDRLDSLLPSLAGQGQSSLEVVGTAATIMEHGRSRARPKMKPKVLPLDVKPKKNPKYDKIGPQVNTGYNARKQLER